MNLLYISYDNYLLKSPPVNRFTFSVSSYLSVQYFQVIFHHEEHVKVLQTFC